MYISQSLDATVTTVLAIEVARASSTDLAVPLSVSEMVRFVSFPDFAKK